MEDGELLVRQAARFSGQGRRQAEVVADCSSDARARAHGKSTLRQIRFFLQVYTVN